MHPASPCGLVNLSTPLQRRGARTVCFLGPNYKDMNDVRRLLLLCGVPKNGHARSPAVMLAHES